MRNSPTVDEIRAGDRGLSGFVARAVENELERDLLEDYLELLDHKFGTVPAELVEHYDSLCRPSSQF